MEDQTPIETLEFSTRVDNCFKNAGIETVGDLMKVADGELLKLPNFGRRSLGEVKDVLADYRLRIAESQQRKIKSENYYNIEELLRYIIKTVEIILDKLEQEHQ